MPHTDHDRHAGASLSEQRRPVVTLRRAGLVTVITPASCATTLAPLRTERHHLGIDSEQRGRVIKVAEPLIKEGHNLRDEPVLHCPAGLQNVARCLLENAGYEVRTTGRRIRPMPEPDIARIEPHGPIDRLLLEFVRGQDRGLIHHDRPGTDPAWLVAQICLAYPRTQIAVLAARESDVHSLAAKLRAYGCDVSWATSRSIPAKADRVLVSTFWQLGHAVLRASERHIVVVLAAVEALGKKPRFALCRATPRARLFGLLDRGETTAPRDRDWIAALFGLEQIVIPRHGHHDRPVEVVSHRIEGGPAMSSDRDVISLKRAGLWHHPVRNRHVSRLARALANGSLDSCSDGIRDLAGQLRVASARRVAVVVENLEHARALARQLPGWSVPARSDAHTFGLPRWHGKILSDRRWPTEEFPERAIATLDTLGSLGLSDLDVLIRADGGMAIPRSLAEGSMVVDGSAVHPLLLVDFADRHHPLLRRWWRSRREAYTARRWSVDGVTPPSIIERFLATRPEVTS